MANVIKHKRGSGSDPAANNLVLGELAIRTDTGKLFTKMDSGAIAEIAGGGSDIAINTLSSSSATGGGSATFNGSAYRFTLSAPPSVSAQQLLVSINGVIQKPVAGTGQPSEGFSVDGTDIILGDAPATGSDFFILTFKSLGVSEPADNSVTSAKIVDGAIVNADINASAAIEGTKISPSFTSDINITNSMPTINLVDNNNTDDFRIRNHDGVFKIIDATDSADRLAIDSSGNVGIGTASPVTLLNLNVDTESNLGSGSEGIRLTSGSSNAQFVRLGSSYSNNSVTGPGTLVYSSNKLSIRCDNSNPITFHTGSTVAERMRITTDGNVLIGTTVEGHSTADDLTIATSGHTGISIRSGTSNNGNIYFSDGTSGNAELAGYIQYSHSSNHMLFGTNENNAMLIDSLGNVLVGASSSIEVASSAEAQMQITQASDGSRLGLSLISVFNGSGPAAILALGHGRGSTSGALQDNDVLGQIRFAGGDGTDMQTQGASINCEVDGTPSSNVMPAALTFKTNGGSASTTERMRIDSSGKVIVKNNNINLENATATNSRTYSISNAAGTTGWTFGNGVIASAHQFVIYDNTAGAARMLIDSSGRVAIGATSSASRLHVETTANTMEPVRINDSNNTNTQTHRIAIHTGGVEVGNISATRSATVYNTNSDYRLKENVVAISDGITRLKTLKPYKFNFKADASTTVDGFFAHEVTAVPEAISGTKDEVDSDNKPVYQGIDQSKLVPLIVAALQEAIGRIEVLEAK